MALVHNRPDFVELLLETGVDLKAFLSKRRLYYLYNSEIVRNAEKKCPLLQLFNKEKLYLRQEVKEAKKNHEELQKKFITFGSLKMFLKKYFFEDFKPAFLPHDAYRDGIVNAKELVKDLESAKELVKDLESSKELVKDLESAKELLLVKDLDNLMVTKFTRGSEIKDTVWLHFRPRR
jgi:hypothetical protein